MAQSDKNYVGVFDDEIDAAVAYNRYVIKNNLRNKLNFIVDL